MDSPQGHWFICTECYEKLPLPDSIFQGADLEDHESEVVFLRPADERKLFQCPNCKRALIVVLDQEGPCSPKEAKAYILSKAERPRPIWKTYWKLDAI